MEELLKSVYVQYGLVGLSYVGLVWLAKYFIFYNFEQLKDKDKENKELNERFINHLATTEQKLFDIIKENVIANNALSNSINNQTELLKSIHHLVIDVNSRKDENRHTNR